MSNCLSEFDIKLKISYNKTKPYNRRKIYARKYQRILLLARSESTLDWHSINSFRMKAFVPWRLQYKVEETEEKETGKKIYRIFRLEDK